MFFQVRRDKEKQEGRSVRRDPLPWLVLISLVILAVMGYGDRFGWWDKLASSSSQKSVGEIPVVTLENFSGCQVGVDEEGIAAFFKSVGFTKELRIFLIPGPIPTHKGPTNGIFVPTLYGAEISLNSTLLGTNQFGETLDHEFGHMAQWLTLGEERIDNLSELESEDYAITYEETTVLDFIVDDVPALLANEEGNGCGPFLYRLEEEEEPKLYVFNDDIREDNIWVIINGELKVASAWEKGWYVVPSGEFEKGLVTHKGFCARLN